MSTTPTFEQVRAEAVKPLLAFAGATDAAVEFALGYAAEAQKFAQPGRLGALVAERKVPDFAVPAFGWKNTQAEFETFLAQARKRFAEAELPTVDLTSEGLKGLRPEQVREAVADGVSEFAEEARNAQQRFEAFVAAVQKDAQALPTTFQAQVTEAVSDLVATYEELAERGEKLVASIRKNGLRKTATARFAGSVEVAQEAPVEESAVKKTPAKKASAKKATAKKAPATKTAAKKAPATKTAAKKAPAKKTAAKKTTAKRTTKKAAAKK